MDRGGEVELPGSSNTLFSKDFNGCSAIYAKTNTGLFGLYHLRSSEDYEPHIGCTLNVQDTNEPFRNWMRKLAQESKGEQLIFYIGTPHNFDYPTHLESHPNVGMEGYIRNLCKHYKIEKFEIILLDMRGIQKVVVDKQGLQCWNNQGRKIDVSHARFQTDEAILDNFDAPVQIRLNWIHKNMDPDYRLEEKYVLLRDIEMLRAKIENLFNNNPKGDVYISHSLIFIELLLQAVISRSNQVLSDLKKEPFYSTIVKKMNEKSFLSRWRSPDEKAKLSEEIVHSVDCAEKAISKPAEFQRSLADPVVNSKDNIEKVAIGEPVFEYNKPTH
ncbi:hypothetical protein ACQUW5_01040 [Legionella sp. CNM-1927-20]|uniref:hypothetical protein n=1 Tax=Legionella sp. CNM-1927-20 TaxID=3422221 RepID=UPI00403B252D